MNLTELEYQRTNDKTGKIVYEGDVCLKGNVDKRTREGVSKFGNC
jgi:hypothetical protein